MPEQSDPPTSERTQREPDWQRRRRLAEVFGDVLPETTSDERPSGAGVSDTEGGDPGERWLRDQVPPHHGS